MALGIASVTNRHPRRRSAHLAHGYTARQQVRAGRGHVVDPEDDLRRVLAKPAAAPGVQRQRARAGVEGDPVLAREVGPVGRVAHRKAESVPIERDRAGQETGSVEGTGVGPSITKRHCERMGGSVGFTSVEGEVGL